MAQKTVKFGSNVKRPHLLRALNCDTSIQRLRERSQQDPQRDIRHISRCFLLHGMEWSLVHQLLKERIDFDMHLFLVMKREKGGFPTEIFLFAV